MHWFLVLTLKWVNYITQKPVFKSFKNLISLLWFFSLLMQMAGPLLRGQQELHWVPWETWPLYHCPRAQAPPLHWVHTDGYRSRYQIGGAAGEKREASGYRFLEHLQEPARNCCCSSFNISCVWNETRFSLHSLLRSRMPQTQTCPRNNHKQESQSHLLFCSWDKTWEKIEKLNLNFLS